MVDIRQTLHYADFLRREGWIVERIGGINYFIRKFPLVGSILKLQRPEKIDLKEVSKLYRKYRIFQLIVEPKNALQGKTLANNGFKLTSSPYLPSKTLEIDLTQTKENILKASKKDVRYALKRGSTVKIKECSTSNEIKKFREVWKNSVNFDRYVPRFDQLINLRKSFPNNSSLILTSHNIVGRIIGGVIFTISSHENKNDTCYYWYGFTNKEGRTSLSQYSLLYQGILWAKKMGCTTFDFEGIYDSRFPNKSWLGFTHFKKSFGGYEVLYPGCYTKFRLPL